MAGVAMSRTSRDGLMVLLALTTGAVDATAFERLGKVFASVITGNLVLLGVSAARPDGRAALLAGVALVAYAVGVLAAAPRRSDGSEEPRGWPRAARAALAGDLVLLIALSVGWELSGGRPGQAVQPLLLAAAASAMGIQSAAVRRLGPMSTTYLTSTFIGVWEAVAARRWSTEENRSVAILAAALVGAAGATALILGAPRVLPVLVLAPPGVVLAAS
jgi:uncharacterized membrane protein YoaK (UPF0700 family)